jgi:hypothetical protein
MREREREKERERERERMSIPSISIQSEKSFVIFARAHACKPG